MSHLLVHILNVKQFYSTHLSGATTVGQRGPGSNGNERVLHIPSNFRAGTSQSDGLVSYLGYSFGVGPYLCGDTIGVFYSPSRLD